MKNNLFILTGIYVTCICLTIMNDTALVSVTKLTDKDSKVDTGFKMGNMWSISEHAFITDQTNLLLLYFNRQINLTEHTVGAIIKKKLISDYLGHQIRLIYSLIK